MLYCLLSNINSLLRKDMRILMISYYNEETDSVDIILSSRMTLRLPCQKIFDTISTTPKTYELMVKLTRENPTLFAEMALDNWLESYLDGFS